MDKFYLINYNRLFLTDTKSLIKIFLEDSNISYIAEDVLISENRLLDNSINKEVLSEILNHLEIEGLWALASCSKEFEAARLAYECIMTMIDEIAVRDRRESFRLIK